MSKSAETVLIDTKRDDMRLYVTLCENEMEVRGWLSVPPACGLKLLPAQIISRLKKHEIQHGLHLDRIRKFCSQASKGDPLTNFLLASGTPAKHGIDQKLELKVKAFSGRSPLKWIEKEERYEMSEYETVKSGDLVAVLHPASGGRNGITLTGKELPAKHGESLKVRPGSNIRLHQKKDSTIEFRSIASGLVIYENNTLSVSESLLIDGDASQIVGNIDFPGHVHVLGDVSDGIHIKAGKNITVEGNVEAATLESEASIRINGAASRYKGLLRCKDNFYAQYLNRTTVECNKDVYVENEILKSQVHAEGAIRIPKGTIIGGESIAKKGIIAGTLGSQLAVHTRLIPGISSHRHEKIQLLSHEIATVREQVKQLGKKLMPYMEKREKMQVLGSELKTYIRELAEDYRKEHEYYEKLKQELGEERELAHKEGNPLISFNNCVYPQTILVYEEESHTIHELHYKKASIIPSKVEGGYRFTPFYTLQKDAYQLEKNILERQSQGKG